MACDLAASVLHCQNDEEFQLLQGGPPFPVKPLLYKELLEAVGALLDLLTSISCKCRLQLASFRIMAQCQSAVPCWCEAAPAVATAAP